MTINKGEKTQSILTLAFGVLKVFVAVVWIVISLVIIVYGQKYIQDVGDSLEQALGSLGQNIQVVSALLSETIDIFDMVDQALSTVEVNTIDAATTMRDSAPVIEKSSIIVVQDVPNALDDVQSSLPSVIQAATAIDQSLRLLSKFKVTIPVLFGQDFEIGLGINYEPSVPLDEALSKLSLNLEGIPESMRAIESDLITAETNLEIVSDNLLDMASDVDYIREQLEDINPEIYKINNDLDIIQESIQNSRQHIPDWISGLRLILIAFFGFVSVSQIPSIFFGVVAAIGGYRQISNQEKGE